MKKNEWVMILLIAITLLASGVSLMITYTSYGHAENVGEEGQGISPESTQPPTTNASASTSTAPKETMAPQETLTPAPTVPQETLTTAPQKTLTPAPTTAPKETLTPVVIRLTISAVGDVTLGTNQKQTYDKSFHEYYDLYGADYFLKNVKSIFEEDDFSIVNLEGTLTNSENIRTTKEWNHKGKPEYAYILSDASVEAVSLGNNHIMDYQKEGVADTIQNVTDAGMTYAISGTWGDHYGLYETKKGIKIGFVSVNEYYEGDGVYKFLREGLQKLREAGAELVFACMHWGGDKIHTLEENQYEMGRWCIDEGYDLVLGCHPHVLQGIECYKGKYIVYSMGNFCYGGNKNPEEKESMIFQQTFTFVDGVLQADTAIRAIPCRLSSVTYRNDFCPVLLTGEEAKDWAVKMNEYCAEFGLAFDENGYLIKEDGYNMPADGAESSAGAPAEQ